MTWTGTARASSARLAKRHGGPVHLVVVDSGALDPTTLAATQTATVYPIARARTVERMVKDEATGRLIRSDRRTHVITAEHLPAGVDPRAKTAGRAYRILAPADDAAVAAANTAAKRALLGLEVLTVGSRETAGGQLVNVSLEVAG